jgi:rubrerythrin
MQRMERFAVQVYRKQIRAFRRLEIADKLKDAAANEQEHADALTKNTPLEIMVTSYKR